MKTKFYVLAVLFCGLAACQANEDLENARSIHEAPRPALPSAAKLDGVELSGMIPASPAGDALAWAIERMNLAPEATTEAAVLQAFDPSVLERTGAGSLAGEMTRLAGHKPFALVGFFEPPTEDRIIAAIMNRDGFQKLTVAVGPSGRLTTLRFEGVPSGSGTAAAPERSLPFAPAAEEAPAAEAAPAAEGSGAPAEGSDAADGEAAAPTE